MNMAGDVDLVLAPDIIMKWARVTALDGKLRPSFNLLQMGESLPGASPQFLAFFSLVLNFLEAEPLRFLGGRVVDQFVLVLL
jgi:hypothetical protein